MSKLRRVARYWTEVGHADPFNAILTGFGEADGPTSSIDRFFESGRSDAARFVADLERIAPAVNRGRALDFGCGVGRVTRALAEHFESVVGVDIAPTMIDRARELNRQFTRCEFKLNPHGDLRQFQAATFDVVYSRLVLQHLPLSLVRRYVAELVRVTRNDGVLMFQLPDAVAVEEDEAFYNAPVLGSGVKRRVPRSVVLWYRKLKFNLLFAPPPQMELYGMHRDEVVSIVTAAGGRTVEINADRSHGTRDPGFEYWVVRAD